MFLEVANVCKHTYCALLRRPTWCKRITQRLQLITPYVFRHLNKPLKGIAMGVRFRKQIWIQRGVEVTPVSAEARLSKHEANQPS